MKTNRRVIFPSGRGPKEEAEMEVRKQTWLEITSQYMKQNCKEKGDQDLSKQLSQDQILGRIKLAKRVNKG